jgi:DNA gyrase subunit B
MFMKDNTLSTQDGQRMTKNEITQLLVTLNHYCKDLEVTALNLALNPEVLEFFLFNKDLNFKDLKALAKKQYRFLENSRPFELINGYPSGSWLHEGKIQNLHMNDILLNQCAGILEMIGNVKYKYYRLNGEMVSLYRLMQAFEEKKPKNIGRYKGLGEMDPEELAESTILPTTNRTLIRYTMEDVKDEVERIRFINSNKASLLKNIKIRAEDID